jgi:C4-dicarboxylate transporter
MKKNAWILVLFILIGLLAGSLAANSLKSVQAIDFLTKTSPIIWSPAADLLVLSYDFTFRLDVSLLSIIGVLIAVWLYRKL